jgi:hypothetical protein
MAFERPIVRDRASSRANKRVVRVYTATHTRMSGCV